MTCIGGSICKKRHETQIRPGRDKCGRRNCLIVRPLEKCMRARAGGRVRVTRTVEESLAGAPEDMREQPIATAAGRL